MAQNAGVTHFYVDAQELHQSGFADAAVAASPSIAAQYEAALQTGGSIAVPVGEYVANIGTQPELAKSFDTITRYEPDGDSLADVQAFQAENTPEAMEAEIQEKIQAAQAEQESDTQAAEIENQIFRDLQAAGRFDESTNRTQAQLAANLFRVTAQRLDMPVQDLWQRFGLNVQGQDIGGQVFDQALKDYPPSGWTHSESGADAAALFPDAPAQAKPGAVYWTHLGDRTAEVLPNTKGYSHSISGDAAQHMYNNHGDAAHEASRGQIAVTKEDLARIPDIVQNYDFVRTDLKDEMGAQQIAYAKKYDDAVVLYLETASRKKKDFRGITMFKYPPTSDAESKLMSSFDPTQERPERLGAYDNFTENQLFQQPDLSSFDQTAEALGGEAAYQAAKDAGQTELDYQQWVTVRTPEFKQWFGDWENDPANASKVINERTGEPLVVYHGTDALFDTFSKDEQKNYRNQYGAGFYFTSDPNVAQLFGDTVMPVFLNARISLKDKILARRRGIELEADYIQPNDDRSIYVVFDPNQIKSATDNNGSFDAENDNIYYQLDETLQSAVVQPTRQASTFAEAREQAKAFQGKPLTNRSSGVEAVASRNSLDKMLSQKAVGKSSNPKLHAAAVANADTLFENAVLGWSKPDRDGDVNLTAIHRFFSVMEEDGKSYLVKMTVKETARLDQPNKYYSIEAIDINEKSPAASWVDSTVREDNLDPTSIRSAEDVRRLADFVEKSNHNKSLRQNAAQPRGAFNPDSLTITLTPNADLSTFTHELGHFAFEMHSTLAADMLAKQSRGEALSAGEQQLLDDMQTAAKWLGLDDVNHWHRLSFEEKRPLHEQMARGFEAYIFEGKAPNTGMRRVFQRLRAWMVAVYKRLTAMNVKLSDDVRQVFDRMVATDEEIAFAEQNRSLMPLFDDPETAGMSAEEFAQYHADIQAADADAKEALAQKAVRDMKYLRNARNQHLRALQKQADDLRKEAERLAAREVMREPVYQVWQRLSARMTDNDRVNTNSKPKFSKQVDNRFDSLFVAIAKLGGVNKDELISEWGFDLKDKIPAPAVGFPVLRRSQGRSINAMLEALAEEGYLPLDENGKADIHDFEDRFFAELRGDMQYSNAYVPIEPKAGENVSTPVWAVRLDEGSLYDMGFSETEIQLLRERKMVQKSGGWHPDLLAGMVLNEDAVPYYASGEALVREVLAAEPPKAVIERRADEMMLREHGELATQKALEEAADEAVYNKVRTRVLSREYNALAQQVGMPSLVQKAAEDYAAKAIGSMPLNEIKPHLYRRMAAKAAKAANAAMKKGDIQTAANEKRNQIIQAALAEQAQDALNRADKIRKQFSDWGNRTRSRYTKTHDVGMVEAVKSVVGIYGIASKKGEKAAEYIDRLKQYDPQSYEQVQNLIHRAFADVDAKGKHKTVFDMTPDELQALHDELKSLMSYARRSKQVEIDGRMESREEVVAQLSERLKAVRYSL